MLESFVRPPVNSKEQCRHLDGNRQNDVLPNLAWGTPQENADDRVKHGNSLKGSKHNLTHLTEDDVLRIRSMFVRGDTQLDLSKEYGVTRRSINNIVRRKTWTHI